MTDEFQVSYAYSKGATEEHKKACTDALSALVGCAQNGKIAVVDCYSADALDADGKFTDAGGAATQTIIAALIDAEGGQAILPLARLFNADELPNETLVPCIKVEADAEEEAA